MIDFLSLVAVALGLLAVTMTPCLIQLVFVYFAAVSGVSVAEANRGAVTESELRAHRLTVIKLTLAFVVGFTIVFTAAGGLVGLYGEAVRDFPLWGADSTLGERIFGVGFVILGLWMANVTRAPVACKIPFPSFDRDPQNTSVLGMFSIGFLYMFGCATCFSGAIFAGLLAVLGTTAAPLEGALVMLLFSLGIGVPLLVAATLLTDVFPYLARFQRVGRIVSLVASLFIVGMGIVAISGNFHVLSDLIATVLL